MGERTKRGPAALPSALALLVAMSLGAAAAARGAPAPQQEVARLFSAHTARTAPNMHARKLEIVPALRPLTAERTTLPVLGHKTSPNGRQWLRVLLPGRPNGHTGWIKERATTRAVTRWRILV